MEKSGSNTNKTGFIRKLTLADGSQVGIINLDAIIREVAEMKLADAGEIEKELLERVKACNYVASRAEKEYSSALLREYRKKLEPEKFKETRAENHRHAQG